MTKPSKKTKRLSKNDLVLQKLNEIASKVCELETQLAAKADKPLEPAPKPVKPKHLGEGVSLIPKPPLPSNQVGGDKFIHESGTTQIFPKEVDNG